MPTVGDDIILSQLSYRDQASYKRSKTNLSPSYADFLFRRKYEV